jgi:hypothetical protein
MLARPLIELFLGNRRVTSESDNFFTALLSMRRELELENLQMACNGAAENVYPSRMQLDMGSGRKAYKLTYGQQAIMKDVVDIFEYDKEKRVTLVQGV